MLAEAKKDLARRYWELMDNLDLIDEVYAPDLVWHEPNQDIQGLEEARQYIGMTDPPSPSCTLPSRI